MSLSVTKPPAPTEEASLRTDEIREQLNKIITSATFRGSLRLTSFLRFVVEAALTGRGSRIKAYTVAVEALGRPDDFDPQNDPIVRVEAVRLRHALANYYAGTGIDDPIVIDIPRGCYVPIFAQRGIPANLHVAAATARTHEAPSTVQIVLQRLHKLRRQLTLVESEIESAATLLEQAGWRGNGRAA